MVSVTCPTSIIKTYFLKPCMETEIHLRKDHIQLQTEVSPRWQISVKTYRLRNSVRKISCVQSVRGSGCMHVGSQEWKLCNCEFIYSIVIACMNKCRLRMPIIHVKVSLNLIYSLRKLQGHLNYYKYDHILYLNDSY